MGSAPPSLLLFDPCICDCQPELPPAVAGRVNARRRKTVAELPAARMPSNWRFRSSWGAEVGVCSTALCFKEITATDSVSTFYTAFENGKYLQPIRLSAVLGLFRLQIIRVNLNSCVFSHEMIRKTHFHKFIGVYYQSFALMNWSGAVYINIPVSQRNLPVTFHRSLIQGSNPRIFTSKQ